MHSVSKGGEKEVPHVSPLIALTPYLQYADSIPEVAFQLIPLQLVCQDPPKAKHKIG